MKLKILFSLGFFSVFAMVAQTGPGGIGSSGDNNFWLDANSLDLSNGDPVTVFSDVSGNGNSFEQFTVADQPTYTTGQINGLPALVFDGSSDYMRSGTISALESSELTWFVVYKKASNQAQGLIGGNYDSNPKQWLSYANNGSDYVYNGHTSMGSLRYVRYIDDGSAYTFASTHITSSNVKSYREGYIQGTRNATYFAPSGHNFVSLGHYPSITTSYFLNGGIAESFAFSKSLNDLERVIVENYLGAKYGFSIPQDFYSFQATHNIGVIGIGNDGVDTHTSSQGAGVLSLLSPLSMTSNEYLFAGHTNVAATELDADDIPLAISTHSRLARTWRIDETGDVGTLTVVFDLGGGVGFADPATYNLLIDTDGTFSDATIVPGIYNAGAQTMTFNVDLNSGDFITLSGLAVSPGAIYSITSGDWYETTTWDCSCLPTLSDTVYVESSHNVNVNADAYVYNLNITNGGTLTMSSDVEMSVFGDFSNSGTFTSSAGTISFKGSEVQTISSNSATTTFNNLTIENIGTSNVTFNDGNYLLNGTLSPNDGSMVIDVGTSFTINSTSSATSGRIGRIITGFTLSGNVIVKRFLAAGNADSRNICSPVIGATLAEWDSNLEISGEGFPDGCAYGPEGCYYSVKTNEHGEYDDVTDINTVLLPGEGYEVFCGTDLTTFAGTTLTSTGTIHAGEFTTPSYPFSWNIQGNPFVSPILYSDVVRNGHTSNYFYIYDAATGAYQWYDGSSNTSSIPELANGLLAIGQGYWTEGFGSITYPQTCKSTNSATFIRNSNEDKSIYLTMTEEGTTYSCGLSVDFDEMALDSYDSLDIKHLMTGMEKASSLMIDSDNGMLRKQYLLNDRRDKVLDLSLNILREGIYNINCNNWENINDYNNIQLLDLMSGELIDLRVERYYAFYAEKGEDQRFKLILSNRYVSSIETVNNVNGVDEEGIVITQIGKAINLLSDIEVDGISVVEVTNLLGQDVVYKEEMSIVAGSNLIYLPSGLKGVYLVLVKSSKGIKTKKIIL